MIRHSHRPQRTIVRPVEVSGVGFLTGADVRLRFLPAPPNTGHVFVRTDLDPRAYIPARCDFVTDTRRRTTLGHLPAQVGLVEHVLASLAGLRIDNCSIELNAPEPPGLDGSAQGFVTALSAAGIETQNAQRAVYRVETPAVVRQGHSTLTLHPATDESLTITYTLDYGANCAIDRQSHTQVIKPELFIEHLAPSRTFLLEAEADALREQGLGSRTTPADLLVFGSRGPINNTLRFADEPARHKVLDIVGDLALLGHDLCGHVVAYRSGHPLNVELARTLHQRVGTADRRAA